MRIETQMPPDRRTCSMVRAIRQHRLLQHPLQHGMQITMIVNNIEIMQNGLYWENTRGCILNGSVPVMILKVTKRAIAASEAAGGYSGLIHSWLRFWATKPTMEKMIVAVDDVTEMH